MDAQLDNFAAAAMDALGKKASLNRREKMILAVMNWPESNRKTRIVSRLERHARASIGEDFQKVIDWFKANWVQVVQVLCAVIPLLLILGDKDEN